MRKMFDLNILLLKCGGLWLLLHKTGSYIYFINFVIMVITLSTFVITEIIEMKNSINDVDRLLEGMIIFPSICILLVRIPVLYMHREQFLLVTQNFKLEYDYFKRFKKTHTKIIDDGLKWGKFLTNVLVSSISVIGCSIVIPPALQIILQNNDSFITGETNCKDMLSFRTALPVLTPTKWTCVLFEFWQAVAATFVVAQALGCDTSFVVMLIYLTSCVKALQKSIITISSPAIESLNLPVGYDLLRNSRQRELGAVVDEEMKQATKCLQRLIRIAKDIDEIFRYIALPQITFALFSLMSTLFSLSSTEIFSKHFLIQLLIYLAFIYEVSLFCVLGDQVSTAFSEVLEAFYDTSWYSESLHFRKMIIMNMTRLGQPVYITVGKFKPLSLTLLTQVVRLSYSFYTVVRK